MDFCMLLVTKGAATVYRVCRNMEDIMGLFSEELYIMDKNTERYMIDQMQEKIDQQEKVIEEKNGLIEEKDGVIEEKNGLLEEKNKAIEEKNGLIEQEHRKVLELQEILRKLQNG